MFKYIKLNKRVIFSVLSVLLVLTVGCGNSSDNDPGEITTVQEITEENEVENEVTTEEAGIVYDELTDVSQISDGKYTCTYENVKHDFIVYLPDNTENAPFVVMLHGYGDSAEGFCNNVHFEEEACQKGYAVIYVEGATDPNDSTSSKGWNSGISSDGNNDVAFLCSLAKYLEKEYSFSEEKAYAVGFSNGAFMIHRLAMEGSDVYTGFVSVAGKMPERIWNSKNENNNISFFQVTGEKDDVVPKNSDGSSKYSNDPAIEDVIDYWASSNNLIQNDSTEIGNESVLTKYSNDDTDVRVWNLDVKNGRHSWPDESLCGFDMNSIILDFFEGK